MDYFTSDVSQEKFPVSRRISAKTLRDSLFDLIKKEIPGFTRDSFLSISELNDFREKYISDYLINQIGELTKIEKTVLKSITKKSSITEILEDDDSDKLTFGQKLADKVATFGGSWTFISIFIGFLIVWILLNFYWLQNRGFDPFPFILLNLILSCIAALQAPVIMMSQNRQEDKDRERSKKDYMINLKSEVEIRTLHEKIDHFILHQQQELLEIQKIQIEMMDDILKTITKN